MFLLTYIPPGKKHCGIRFTHVQLDVADELRADMQMHTSLAFAGNSKALFGRSPWSFIRRFIARVLGAFHTNPLTGTNFGAYDSEATACRMSAFVQSPIELPSVDARSSAPYTWCSRTRNDRYRKVFHEFLVLRSAIISKRVSLDEVFLERQPGHRETWYIERQNKVHSDEGKWSGQRTTCPKQDPHAM